jgi:hypothetical protein
VPGPPRCWRQRSSQRGPQRQPPTLRPVRRGERNGDRSVCGGGASFACSEISQKTLLRSGCLVDWGKEKTRYMDERIPRAQLTPVRYQRRWCARPPFPGRCGCDRNVLRGGPRHESATRVVFFWLRVKSHMGNRLLVVHVAVRRRRPAVRGRGGTVALAVTPSSAYKPRARGLTFCPGGTPEL